MEQLWTQLQECLPVAGLTALTDPVKRCVWGALLQMPEDVARVVAEDGYAPVCASRAAMPRHAGGVRLLTRQEQ